jgi:hypothetical protein
MDLFLTIYWAYSSEFCSLADESPVNSIACRIGLEIAASYYLQTILLAGSLLLKCLLVGHIKS